MEMDLDSLSTPAKLTDYRENFQSPGLSPIASHRIGSDDSMIASSSSDELFQPLNRVPNSHPSGTLQKLSPNDEILHNIGAVAADFPQKDNFMDLISILPSTPLVSPTKDIDQAVKLDDNLPIKTEACDLARNFEDKKARPRTENKEIQVDSFPISPPTFRPSDSTKNFSATISLDQSNVSKFAVGSLFVLAVSEVGAPVFVPIISSNIGVMTEVRSETKTLNTEPEQAQAPSVSDFKHTSQRGAVYQTPLRNAGRKAFDTPASAARTPREDSHYQYQYPDMVSYLNSTENTPFRGAGHLPSSDVDPTTGQRPLAGSALRSAIATAHHDFYRPTRLRRTTFSIDDVATTPRTAMGSRAARREVHQSHRYTPPSKLTHLVDGGKGYGGTMLPSSGYFRERMVQRQATTILRSPYVSSS